MGAANKELNETQRVQLLIDAIGDYAIYMLDANGFVISWNPAAEKISGYRSDEIVGQHFSRLFTPEDQANGVPAQILQEARTARRCESEGWRVRKDGGRFWASLVVDAIRDSSGELLGFSEITRDITERQAVQEALRESERQFRLLIDSVLDYAIYMLDPSGVVISWNTGAQRLKGYAPEEVIGQHFSRFYTKEDRADGMPLRVLEIAEREGRYESEGWRVRKDGSRFWASAIIDAIRGEDGELVGFAKITRDITERQMVQEALRESERQFRLLVEGVTDYAIYLLDLNGVVTNWNAGAQRIKGYTAEEIVGHHFSRFYTEPERAAGLPARALYTATQEGRYEAEGWRVRKDGTLFFASVIIDAIRDESGNLMGFAKITRDITERREAQISLQKAQVQRNYAQKMEALGQLTGGIAHDFNNLLMIINGHLQTVEKVVAKDAKGQRAAEAIGLAASRAEALTRQLLTFARRQTLNPVMTAPGERIEAARALLASPLGVSVRLVADIPAEIWPVKVDIGEFELALVNIALNSRDAMPDGGIVTITAENVQLRAADTPAALTGDFVALTIVDSGCGIAPDILPKVFDPFFTTKRASTGTGLGLSQVHGFAHQCGGTVTIASELGRGTRVTLYLPRAEAVADEAQQPPDADAESAGAGSVLLVEDNPEVADVTAAMLEQLGYRVHAVENAEVGLQAVADGKFDLVVSDIVMAGAMDGLALARAIRERHPGLPVILVTGYSNTANIADKEFTVLRKPYRMADLGRAAAKVVANARQPAPSNLVHLRDARRGSH